MEPRAAEALNIMRNAGFPALPQDIWWTAAASTPAVGQLFDLLGITAFQRVPTGRSRKWTLVVTPKPRSFWRTTLEDVLFHKAPAMRLPTRGAELARTTGKLSVDAIIVGILEASRGYPPNAPRMNIGFRRVARAAGVHRPVSSTRDDVRAFSERAVEAFLSLRQADPSLGEHQLVLWWDGNGYRIRPFGAAGAFRLERPYIDDGSIWIGRGNSLEPSRVFSGDALAALELLINGNAPERSFQEFFEEHPEFILVLGQYSQIHPQLILHEDEGTQLIPDFFLERVNSDFCDICDLKRADAEIVRHQRNRNRFRDAVMEGVSQLTRYRDFFDEASNREAFRDRYGLEAFRPRVVLIIGRRSSFLDDMQRTRVESGIPSWVSLTTYDDVLSSARNWRQLATGMHGGAR